MKAFVCWIVAALALAASLSGCGTVNQETAMQWLVRQQPVSTDDP